MNISIYTTDYPPMIGGISSYNIALAEVLSSAEEVGTVTVYVFNQKNESTEEADKLNLRRIRTPGLWKFWKEVSSCIRSSHPEEIIHATSLFPTGFFCALASWWYSRVCILSIYGTDILSTKGSFFTNYAKIVALRMATGILAISNSTALLAARKTGIVQTKFLVLSYPMPESPSDEILRTKKSFGFIQEDFVVLFVGHLVKRKGCADLIRAIAQVHNTHVKLLIAGYGPERDSLERLVSELGIVEQVVFIGNQDPKPLYYLAQVFSMPSYFDKVEGDIEGLGIVYLEAQQRGVAVIGTRSGGIPEAMEEGVTGYLVDEHDYKALAEKILYLKNNEEVRNKMGEAGKRFVQKKFGMTKILQRHLDYYASLFKKTC